MNGLFSTAHLCAYGLIFTLFLVLWTGGKGLLDLRNGKSRPDTSTVNSLFLCFSMIALVDLFLLISGLILGKGMTTSEIFLGWSGIIVGALLYMWSKKFTKEKDKKDALLSFPSWILCFASTGIGACARTLFLH